MTVKDFIIIGLAIALGIAGSARVDWRRDRLQSRLAQCTDRADRAEALAFRYQEAFEALLAKLLPALPPDEADRVRGIYFGGDRP